MARISVILQEIPQLMHCSEREGQFAFKRSLSRSNASIWLVCGKLFHDSSKEIPIRIETSNFYQPERKLTKTTNYLLLYH